MAARRSLWCDGLLSVMSSVLLVVVVVAIINHRIAPPNSLGWYPFLNKEILSSMAG